MTANVRIRRATVRDCEAIARMSALASKDEGVPPSSLDADLVRAHGFGQTPLFDAFVAEINKSGLVGHAITFKGYDVRYACPTMVLAELYVVPEMRREGVARRLISELARRAREIGCRRMNITTGLENAVAHRFYAAIGAREEGTRHFLLAADAIEWLAAEGA
jgi:GNAT superfamily N-acetyltransferase